MASAITHFQTLVNKCSSDYERKELFNGLLKLAKQIDRIENELKSK